MVVTTWLARGGSSTSTMTLIYNTHSMKNRRQELWHSAPRAEAILWRYLKEKQLDGYKFRRQYSIGGYVVDFLYKKMKTA